MVSGAVFVVPFQRRELGGKRRSPGPCGTIPRQGLLLGLRFPSAGRTCHAGERAGLRALRFFKFSGRDI